jgi:hypothetical protein
VATAISRNLAHFGWHLCQTTIYWYMGAKFSNTTGRVRDFRVNPQ